MSGTPPLVPDPDSPGAERRTKRKKRKEKMEKDRDFRGKVGKQTGGKRNNRRKENQRVTWAENSYFTADD